MLRVLGTYVIYLFLPEKGKPKCQNSTFHNEYIMLLKFHNHRLWY